MVFSMEFNSQLPRNNPLSILIPCLLSKYAPLSSFIAFPKFSLNMFQHFQILRDLGVRTMKLMTNNPAKYSGLKGYGLAVDGRVPLVSLITKENKRYLETKRSKMGHVYGHFSRSPSSIASQNGKPSTENPSEAS